MTLNRMLLLDSDIIAYAAASRHEERHRWDGPDGPVTAVIGPFGDVREDIELTVADYMRKLRASAVLVCLSCDRTDNWRKDVLPSYKDNRAGTEKPHHLSAAKQYMASRWNSLSIPRLEADDVLGIVSTSRPRRGYETVIVSEDKDLKTIPGLLWNPRKDSGFGPTRIEKTEADYWHLYQTLTGDSTDGYPGCPGIGPKKAKALLDGTPQREHWAAVVGAFQARLKGTREEAEKAALVQARVARILRVEDFNFTERKPILWNP